MSGPSSVAVFLVVAFVLSNPALAGDLEQLVEWMSGSLSSAPQATADPEFHDVRIHAAPIWTEREDGKWIYVEQALSTDLDRPYRQRVYRVRALAPGLYESAVYELPQPETVVGAWREPTRLGTLEPEDLEPRAGCEVLLRRRGEAFVGGTLGRLCPSELAGATYATSEVTVTADQMVSWDRGFDAAGRQVWGAEKGGYVFQRAAD